MATKKLRNNPPAAAPTVTVSKLSALKQDPRNANAGTDRGRELLKESLRQYGAARSIVVDRQGVIIGGNKTQRAAMDAGLEDAIVAPSDGTRLVVVQRTDLDLASDPRAAELGVADNRIGELGLAWDASMLEQLVAEGVSLGGLFSGDELAALIPKSAGAGLTDPDDAPSARPTGVLAGDLFQLGQHRLMCGDSTRLDQALIALGGDSVDAVFTDPPYGVNVTSAGGNAIEGDISFTAIPLMFDVLDKELAPGAWCYVCGGQSNMPLYGRMFERYFRRLPQVIVWDKGSVSVMRPNGYHSCFEFIYYAFREGGGARWFGGRDGDSADDIVHERAPSSTERVHPTQKPVSLAARAIRNSCAPTGLVFEPFGGSGSTLISACMESRRCVVMEIDPKYCQVIIDRWEAFTGLKATKVGEVRA